MTVVTFADETLTIHRSGVSFSADLGELAAKELRDQLLERYPVEPEATPVTAPLREVTLAEARHGDIATFEIKDSPSVGKFVCTLKMNGDDVTLLADRWLTANQKPSWCIRNYAGNVGAGMKDLHIWRWDGVEEAVELPEEPTVAGFYITPTSDQVLYNDGDIYANWSRPKGAKWSTGCTYEGWGVVVHDLGSEQLPLRFISKKKD